MFVKYLRAESIIHFLVKQWILNTSELGVLIEVCSLLLLIYAYFFWLYLVVS